MKLFMKLGSWTEDEIEVDRLEKIERRQLKRAMRESWNDMKRNKVIQKNIGGSSSQP